MGVPCPVPSSLRMSTSSPGLPSSSSSSSNSLLSLCLPDVDWAGDPDRAAFLMAPFRSRELNPQSWAEKDALWRRAVNARMALAQGQVCFRLEALKSDFSLEDGSAPHGLREVLERMAADRDSGVERLAEVRQELDRARSGSSWVWRSARAVAGSVTSRIWPFPASNSGQEDVYVSRKNLDWSSFRIMSVATKLCENNEDRLHLHRIGAWCLVPLEQMLVGVKLTEEETGMCLDKLQVDRKIALRDIDGVRYAKVPAATRKSLKTAGAVSDISDCEAASVRLADLLQVLEEGVSSKEKRQEELRSQARAALKAGDKAKARTVLSRELALRAGLERQRKALLNLESLLSSLAQSREDAEVAAAFKEGARALRQTLADREKVEEAVEEVRDAMEQSDQISSLISAVGFEAAGGEDEEELEKELEELVKQQERDSEKSEEDVTRRLDKLKVVADDGPEEEKQSVEGAGRRQPERASVPL